VRFCCKGCTDDFEKNPAKFLKLIDEAAAKKAHP
jgi:YHS domain-containing protein